MLAPSIDVPVELSSLTASSSLYHRKARRVINEALHKPGQPPWRGSRREWMNRLLVVKLDITSACSCITQVLTSSCFRDKFSQGNTRLLDFVLLHSLPCCRDCYQQNRQGVLKSCQ